MSEYDRPMKMSREASTITWEQNIKRDIKKLDIDIATAKTITQNRGQ